MNVQCIFLKFKIEYSMEMNCFKETLTYVLSEYEIWMSMCLSNIKS